MSTVLSPPPSATTPVITPTSGTSTASGTTSSPTVPAADPVSHIIVVTFNPDDVQGYKLYVFKGVTSLSTVTPLVWIKEDPSTSPTTISWPFPNSFQVYAGIMNNGHLSSTSEPMAVGGTATANSDGTLDIDSTKGTAGSFSFTASGANGSDQQYCGLMEQPTGASDFAPYCAVKLKVGSPVVIKPLEKVLLYFGNEPVVDPNTNQITTNSPSFLIDFNALVGTASVTVTFDIDKGWSSASQAANCTSIAANVDFGAWLNRI